MEVTPQTTVTEPTAVEIQAATSQPALVIEKESQTQDETDSVESTNVNPTENIENTNETGAKIAEVEESAKTEDVSREGTTSAPTEKFETAETETSIEETSNESAATEPVSEETKIEQTEPVSTTAAPSNEPAVNALATQTVKINSINRERGANDIVLFTPFYDASTYTNNSGTEVILEGATDVLKPKGEVTATVKEIRKDQGNTKLVEGQMVLSAAGTGRSVLEQLQPGDKMTVRTTVDAPWDQLDEAIGGSQKLVTNGQANVSSDPNVHPRTAVGIKADGSVFFTVIDGRQPGFSEGVNLTDLGQNHEGHGGC